MKENRYSLDPVLPGEQWFCYWRTSAALWEARLNEFSRTQRIYIPLYWGFHAEQNGTWDFGNFHPERDLKRLVQLLTRQGREFTFILPLGPAPFLPNGGVPIQSARTLSKNKNDCHLATLDQDQTLHKMYSFFEQKVYQQFTSFSQWFCDFLIENKVAAPVGGARFYYYENGEYTTFFEDSSMAFEQGFSRYLKKNSPEGVELTQPNIENELKVKFTKEVESLFQSTAEDILKGSWKSVQDIFVLGASPKDTIERTLSDGKSQSRYFDEIFKNSVLGFGLSSVLLNKSEKTNLMNECLKLHFSEHEVNHFPHQNSADFKADILFELFDLNHPEVFDQSGLTHFLNLNSPWMYKRHNDFKFSADVLATTEQRIKFFHGKDLNRTTFAQMVKLFFMGQRVLLDTNFLSVELRKKLEVFYIENNLKIQSVNYQTLVQFVQLGEGMMIVFDGANLAGSVEKQEKFWDKIFKILNIKQLSFELPENVFSFCAIRNTASHELNFLDVRRVSLYNPTSYKKQVSIHTNKAFAFMKAYDSSKAQTLSQGDSVLVELLPNGHVSLDFGHYEERR